MPTTTNFPFRARRDDDFGWMKVQQLLEFLRDVVDKLQNSRSRGSATIAQGSTTLLVSHGLSTPSYSVGVIPLVNPGGNVWASNKTASQFQVNVSVAAPVGGIPFDWFVQS